jgi:hypothetical protein
VARPVVVRGGAGQADDVRVVVPPLAPFSIVEAQRPPAPATTTVWIRYDAVRPMARFRGELVIEATATGQRWRVRLSGSEALARS